MSESQEFIGSEGPAREIESEAKTLAEKAIELEELALSARRQGKIEEAKKLEEQRKKILEEQRSQLRKRASLKEHKI